MVFTQGRGFVFGASFGLRIRSLRFRVLVCHAADTASLATWFLFGKLFCVAITFGFGEKRCRKNLPLSDYSLNSQTWQPVVERYLQACFDDHKRQREAKLSNTLAGFFHEFGTDSVAQRYQANAETIRDTLLPPPPSSEWSVVSESDTEIIVEIPVDSDAVSYSNRVPFTPTRLLLISTGANWRVTDVWQPCIGCSMSRRRRSKTVGQCMMCDGAGNLSPIADKPCDHCDGTGKCPKCKNGPAVGWRRASFLLERP